MSQQTGTLENNMSVLRPAWTHGDLHAYKHLHLSKVKVDNFFVQSHGFASKKDLRLVEGK